MADAQVSARTVLARALLAEGKPARAREEIDSAAGLAAKSQNREVRLRFAVTAARVHEDSTSLGAALAESAKYHLLGVEFEARLALGEIEIKTGRSATGRAPLGALEKDATARGFMLIARNARAASGR